MMKTQYEEIEINNEKIPVMWCGDVLIIGGSAAGVSAGAASARKRVKTMVIEKAGYLGGKVSGSPAVPIRGGFPGYVSLGGIMDEICAKLRFAQEDSAAMADVQEMGVSYYHENEYVKWLSEDILKKSGCCWKLGITVEKILVEEGKIKGVIAVKNVKKYAFLAKVVIDATENGEIAEEIGVIQDGSKKRQLYYPYILENIDTDVLEQYLKGDRKLEKAKACAEKNGNLLNKEDRVEKLISGIREGKVYVDSINLDREMYTETEEVLMAAHRKLFEHIRFYRNYVPGMEKASLHRCGEKLLCELPGKIRGICQGSRNSYREESEFQGILRMEDGTKEHKQIKLPLGMMIPQKADNLLVAGRTCDLDDDLRKRMGAGQEMVLGQCAGVCAATAILRKIMLKDLDEREIHSMLNELGCDIDGNLSRCYKGDKTVDKFSEQEYQEVKA